MTYTLVIGTRNWSSWSLRPWLALKATGVPFEEIVIPLRRADSKALVAKHSPSRRIPVLKIAEAGGETVVFDSLAICETLAERHPEARLWPADANARALARSTAAEMHSGFLALREALPMDFARTLPTPAFDETVRGEIAHIQSSWRAALERFGGPFLFGRFSIADCMYAPVVSRFLTYGIDMTDEAKTYTGQVMALPAMQEWRAAAAREVADGLPDQWQTDTPRNAR